MFDYLIDNFDIVLRALGEHVQMALVAVAIAIAVGVPLGVLISYISPLKKPVVGAANVVQAIPSLAILGFLIPVMGIGVKPAVFMVVLYSLLPIIKNTATGLGSINREMVEAAYGIGMTRFQVLIRVKLPLALPVIMAGVRIAAVTAVGLITIACLIGAGGLGDVIYRGMGRTNIPQILAGAIPACILALAVDFVFSILERLITPACFKTTKTKDQPSNKQIKNGGNAA